MSEPVEPEVAFNVDLANGPTEERYCRAAAALVSREVEEPVEDWSEEVLFWDTVLGDHGFYARWEAGDVVVFDLNPLTEEQREAFFDAE